MIGRRDFITLVGGGAAAWPLAARAQQPDPVRRIGALMASSADDPESQVIVGSFSQGLQESGWTLGRNLRIDYRWGAVDDDSVRRYAAELVALAPDIILASGGTTVRALQRASATMPIVFADVADPVGGGLVASLARPGGNATGFSSIEYGQSGKWLELLKQIAPRVTRAAVIRDPTALSGGGQLGAIQAVASSFGVEVSPIDARDAGAIQGAVSTFALGSNGGLIVTTSRLARHHRDLIIALAARHQLPAVYAYRVYVTDGGLISYAPDPIDMYRRAAGYVDRVIKGEQPADLPVQAPTRYEMVINLKTAKALGPTVPLALLTRADEVIE
jgi:putative ABC transport system substrate-binding protein